MAISQMLFRFKQIEFHRLKILHTSQLKIKSKKKSAEHLPETEGNIQGKVDLYA